MTAFRTLMLLTALLLPATAGAVTVRDIIELSRAGLPDDVLVAVIDADRTIFTLDKAQILELKEAGVSKAVLLKMIRSRREFEPAPEPPPPVLTDAQPQQPEIVVIGGQQPSPEPAAPVVPQYYYVPYYSIWGVPHHRVPRTPPAPFMQNSGFGRFINDGWVDRTKRQ
jgi:hypothetical protein